MLRTANSRKQIVLGSGCFDLLHPGHIAYVAACNELGDIFVVSLLGDKRVREIKGDGCPIQDEQKRATVVDNLKGVDYVVIEPYSPTQPDMLLHITSLLCPNHFAINDESWEIYRSDLKKFGTELHSLHGPKLDSTSDIIERVRAKQPPNF